MTNVTILALVLACILTPLTVVFYFAKQKAERQLERLNGKVLELEARTPVPQSVFKKSEEKRSAPRVSQEDSSSGKELVLLRKEFAKIRDDNRSLRDLLKESETSLFEAKRVTENSLYSLKEENQVLLQQLKELSSAPRKPAAEKVFVAAEKTSEHEKILKDARAEALAAKDESQIAVRKLRAQLEDSEKRIKFETEKSNQHFDKIRQLQIELKRWQEASTAVGGRPVSPSELIRWHDRAMEGRRMYKLMKQLRELSDEKLVRYQTTIIPLATFVLTQKEKSLPEPKAGEVAADRYLFEALNALSPE